VFESTVTLFNFFHRENENKYFPTILEKVEFQPDFKVDLDVDATENVTNSLLLIKYFKISNEKCVKSGKIFKPPKIWCEINEKSEFFTLNCGKDFFVKGDHASETPVIYEGFRNKYDDVFLIVGVKDFDGELSHWEVFGR
jgi:hypothetical protein